MQVVFSPTAFFATYPEFSAVDPSRATLMFTIAEQSLLDNTDNSPVMDINFRTQLFYMLVAHMLLIYGAPTPTQPVNTPPGRLSNATEGTVSTSFDYPTTDKNASMAWYVQTKYGAMYWAATVMFRSAQYYGTGSGVGFSKAYGVPPANVPGGV